MSNTCVKRNETASVHCGVHCREEALFLPNYSRIIRQYTHETAMGLFFSVSWQQLHISLKRRERDRGKKGGWKGSEWGGTESGLSQRQWMTNTSRMIPHFPPVTSTQNLLTTLLQDNLYISILSCKLINCFWKFCTICTMY